MDHRSRELYQRSRGLKLRGTLSGYFCVGAALSLIVLALIGRFGIPELLLALLLLPGIGLGEGYFGSASVAQGLD